MPSNQNVETSGAPKGENELFTKEQRTVLRGKTFFVEQDFKVPIPGFMVIMSNTGARSVSEFTEEQSKEFMEVLRKTRDGMRDALGITEICLFQDEDEEHNFHVWMFPRFGWMERFGKKIESVRPIIEYAKKNMLSEEAIEEVLASVSKMKGYMRELSH